jgi:hypothetical protein
LGIYCRKNNEEKEREKIMSKKNNNPYNAKSNYGKLFAVWKKAQVMTRSGLMEAAKKLGMGDKAAAATVTVLISPRKSDDECRGDCRGNFSAKGHLYYADVLKRKAGEEKRFRLRYRATAMEPRNRQVKEETKAVKAKVKSKAKAPDKSKASKKASAVEA